MSSLRPRYAVLLGVVSLLLAGCRDDGAVGWCGHKQVPWSEPDCPDSLARFVNVEDMTSVELVVRTKSGAKHVTKIPANFDAIFLSQKSIDSILIPYYQGRKGADPVQVQRLRNRVARP